MGSRLGLAVFVGCSGEVGELPKPQGEVGAAYDEEDDVACEPDLVCVLQAVTRQEYIGTCQLPCGHAVCDSFCSNCIEGEPDDFCIDVGCSR